MTTWICVPRSAFQFTGDLPRYFDSSPGRRRGFCGTCGSPLTWENERLPDEIHLYAASLSDPTQVQPERHVFAREQLPWFEVADQLPRFEGTSRGGAEPVRYGPKEVPK
jgi:hypothetical protein